jgi:hypothetical protein
MSIGIYRRVTASTLLAGSLCLLAATAEAAPAPRPGSSRPTAVVSQSGSGSSWGSYWGSSWGSLWTQLAHLFASDHHDAASDGHGGHGHGDPENDEGPGMCPHGHGG